MSKLTKWEITIEYGPTTSDRHFIVANTMTSDEVILLAEKWCKDNSVDLFILYGPYPILDDPDDYKNFLEWTIDEEEEFIRMLEIQENE